MIAEPAELEVVASPVKQPAPRRPLGVMFVKTSMPVGGAETLLVNLIRRMDCSRFHPELCCLKEPGPLGEELASDVPVHTRLLAGKLDLRVFPRLCRLLRQRHIDAVITVGAGDKMFWGRLAAKRMRVPVIAAALHSTGWPDSVGRLNRLLTPATDAFIAVAAGHGRFLVEHERFPANKVCVIPNGVDTDRFAPLPDPTAIRNQLGLRPTAPVVTIVAALRPEKNHEMFLRAADRIRRDVPETRFLIVGDGPCRGRLQRLAEELHLRNHALFLGSRDDIPRILAATDVFALSSLNEANPVSVLEAMSSGCPVVAPQVGSLAESVADGETGFLFRAGDVQTFSARIRELFDDPLRRQRMGAEARKRVVTHWSLAAMVHGYEHLIESIFAVKRLRPNGGTAEQSMPTVPRRA